MPNFIEILQQWGREQDPKYIEKLALQQEMTKQKQLIDHQSAMAAANREQAERHFQASNELAKQQAQRQSDMFGAQQQEKAFSLEASGMARPAQTEFIPGMLGVQQPTEPGATNIGNKFLIPTTPEQRARTESETKHSIMRKTLEDLGIKLSPDMEKKLKIATQLGPGISQVLFPQVSNAFQAASEFAGDDPTKFTKRLNEISLANETPSERAVRFAQAGAANSLMQDRNLGIKGASLAAQAGAAAVAAGAIPGTPQYESEAYKYMTKWMEANKLVPGADLIYGAAAKEFNVQHSNYPQQKLNILDLINRVGGAAGTPGKTPSGASRYAPPKLDPNRQRNF